MKDDQDVQVMPFDEWLYTGSKRKGWIKDDTQISGCKSLNDAECSKILHRDWIWN